MSAAAISAAAPPDAGIRLTEHLVVDTSERQPVYLLAGRNGSHLRLSASAYTLLRLRENGVSCSEIASRLRGADGRSVSADEVEEKYRQLVARIEEIEKESNQNPRGFWLRLRLLPEPWVCRITSWLQGAFHPWLAACLLAAVVVALSASGLRRTPLDLGPRSFWLGYLLLLASVVVHELGHASACRRFGAKPSEIGFTVYLFYPSLYSDVSSAWRLPRGQRVVVDLGGIFFQLLAAAAYAAAYSVSHWEPLRVAVLMIAGSVVFSLNPIFKFDGYWVVADALGVTNLGQQPSRVLRHTLDRLRRRPVAPLPWSAAVTAVLIIYSVVSIGVWGFFLSRIGPMLTARLGSLPAHLADLLLAPSFSSFGALFTSAFMAVFSLFITWRLLRSMILPPLLKAGKRVVATLRS